jgi:hypothetical protein
MSDADRALLERAAQAAGYVLKWTDYGVAQHVSPAEGRIFWNPRDEDGDALRLAVKLRLDVRHLLPCGVEAGTSGYVSNVEFGGDHGAATRVAIVRAAAAMVPA